MLQKLSYSIYKKSLRLRRKLALFNYNLVADFDPKIYQKQAKFAITTEDYQQYGYERGVRSTKIPNRQEFLNLIHPKKKLLEIGPFYSPCLEGKNVKYFDVLDQKDLLTRAKQLNNKKRKVPFIDFVSKIGDLSIIDEKFDIIFSSHCIEHQPDLIDHLKKVANLLGKGGQYFLIIPDKNYCFDHFIPETTLEKVEIAHKLQRKTHSLESVIEHLVLHAHPETKRHWRGDHGEKPTLENQPQKLKNAMEIYEKANGDYIDVHAWQFTPFNFKTIIQALYDNKIIDLKPIRVYPTTFNQVEFCAILEKV